MVLKNRILKNLFALVACAAWLAVASPALADGARADAYRPHQFLSLDLSAAVLSPKLLGPTAQFEPFPVEANTGPEPAPAAEPKAASRVVIPRVMTAQARSDRPRGPARTHLAQHRPAVSHGNPLDAQASDTRIQVWPCRSGGICNWQR